MKIPNWSVPLIIVLMIALSVSAAKWFAIPSLTIDVINPAKLETMTTQVAEFIVSGVSCVDTARTASLAVISREGILRFVAYASHNRLEITYDPSLWTPAKIKDALEGPIYDQTTGNILFNQFSVLEMNGSQLQ
ncbi:hypothetical protein JXQ70_20485 [bacterium]|nr:hypothetical protein [bacterium]